MSQIFEQSKKKKKIKLQSLFFLGKAFGMRLGFVLVFFMSYSYFDQDLRKLHFYEDGND